AKPAVSAAGDGGPAGHGGRVQKGAVRGKAPAGVARGSVQRVNISTVRCDKNLAAGDHRLHRRAESFPREMSHPRESKRRVHFGRHESVMPGVPVQLGPIRANDGGTRQCGQDRHNAAGRFHSEAHSVLRFYIAMRGRTRHCFPPLACDYSRYSKGDSSTTAFRRPKREVTRKGYYLKGWRADS